MRWWPIWYKVGEAIWKIYGTMKGMWLNCTYTKIQKKKKKISGISQNASKKKTILYQDKVYQF